MRLSCGTSLRVSPYSPALGGNSSTKSKALAMWCPNYCRTRDDAGATDASVEINNGEFVLSHNGHDFNEEQFASLCRFGFSNKRTLHTIGFRGIGFKSTFSLGNDVHLVTPTLSVTFRKQRFTEPVWTNSSGTADDRTEVRVVIQNQQVQQELVKNIKEWSESPASLLFFNNIRCLRFDESEIRWESRGSGPVEGDGVDVGVERT